MNRYALVNNDGLVINIVLWDGVVYDPDESPQGWTPPEDLTPVLVDETVELGDVLDDDAEIVVKSEPVPVEPTIEERIAALEEGAK